jgi:PAS domain S-box-containing protein
MLFDGFLVGYSLVCLVIAVILNVKLPRNFTYHFYFVCVLFLILFGGIGFALRFPLPETLYDVLVKILIFLYSLFPFFFLHFIIVYVGSSQLLRSKFIIVAIYATGFFGYILMLLGYIPQPAVITAGEAGLDSTGYVFFITWMSILFALGVAKLYALIGGYHNRDFKSRFLFVGFVILFLALPGPFTETILDEIFGEDVEWYFFSSFFGLGVAVYFIFRHKVTNTLYDSLKSTFSIMDDILIRVDNKYRIEMIRGAITPLLGYTEKELIGKPMSFLVENYDADVDAAKETELNELGESSLFYYYAKSKEGRQVPMNFTFAPIMDEQVITGYIGIGRDFTERKQIESELIQAKKDAENSNRLKTEFLAQMSHEIRTPLNIVVNYAHLLEDELKSSNNESVNSAITAIGNASDRIVRTVDLVLNMSEIQLGIYESDPREFDLYADVMQKLIMKYKKKAEEKGLEFNVVNKIKETKIIADEYSIEEIFSNLLDNAIKFTESGLIEIIITGDKYNRIQVEVVDTGIGIDRNYIKHLYEPFTQELHGYSRKYEGNGLGLSVVKKFCDLNKATIQVDTEKNVGTTFRVILNRDMELA